MIKHLQGALLGIVVVLGWGVGTSTARADDWNRETILAIDQPMIIPGATLAPGTYTFTLADDNGARDLVYIFRDDNGTRTFVTSAQVVRMQRDNANRDLTMTVALNASGATPIMTGWFYPGANDGFEFLYPKAQARTVARAETVEIHVAPLG